MAYEAPALADFRVRYPEFAGVPDATVQAQLSDAGDEVSHEWVERDYAKAIMLLAAHRLLVAGAIDIASGETSSMTTSGAISALQVGDVRVTYGGAGGGSGGSASYPEGYGASEYGRRFYDLLRKNFAGPIVV